MAKSKYYIIFVSIIMLILPFTVGSEYLVQSLIMIVLYAYWASSWNIIGGFGGQMSLGHATYIGIGAYVSTVLFTYNNISPWFGMIIGGIIGGIVGIIIGYPCFKLKGSYYTLATIALLNIVRIFVTTNDRILGYETRAAEGLSVPWYKESFINMEFLNKKYYYYIILALLAVVLLVSYWIKNSRIGYYLAAINTNQEAANSLGVNVTKYKLIAQFISAFFTAVGGCFYAQLILFVAPDRVLGYDLSVEIVILAIIGGKGTILGPVIGAFILEPISQLTRAYIGSNYAGLSVVVFGLVLMLTVYYMPNGLEQYFVGFINKFNNRKLKKQLYGK